MAHFGVPFTAHRYSARKDGPAVDSALLHHGALSCAALDDDRRLVVVPQPRGGRAGRRADDRQREEARAEHVYSTLIARVVASLLEKDVGAPQNLSPEIETRLRKR